MFDGTITILRVAPVIAPDQRVTLLLNHIERENLAYRFPADPRERDSRSVTGRVGGLETGRYIVRLLVGQIDSPVELEVKVGANGQFEERLTRPFVDIP